MNEYNGIKVGDLIKATCFKGFLRVTSIEKRVYTKEDEIRYSSLDIVEGKEYNPLIRFEYAFNESGTPIKRKPGAVDGGWTILAKDHIQHELRKLNETRERLNIILNNEL